MSHGIREKDDDDGPALRRERDLYRSLLQLGLQTAPAPFLTGALALVTQVVEARQGYLEIFNDDGAPDGTPWWTADGFSEQDLIGVRKALSSGIIGEAIATGRTIETPAAFLDPRFSKRSSVALGRIEAVLCTPVGADPPRGVLYLQGRRRPGPFSDDDRARAELVAEHLAPLAERLIFGGRPGPADPTASLRARLRLDGVIGRSPALARVLEQVALVAPLDVNVLLTGDSGTGKSQLARCIHDNGPRAGQPFVEVNCAAIPEQLVESELFGALPGAHSTALRRIPGKVEAAERGTLFLDEIGELCPAAQAKLLQLLQSRQYYPLASPRALRADVRLIAASNADLQRAVAERRFRDDLYYRLQVLPIHVPALAERRGDIAELAAVFCERTRARHGLPQVELSRDAIRDAEAAEWPGNVRQLENAIEASAIRAVGEGATRITRRHLFPESADATAAAPTFQAATRRFQAQLVQRTLEDCNWNVVETARRLGLTRSHVYNLIRAFGLERTR